MFIDRRNNFFQDREDIAENCYPYRRTRIIQSILTQKDADVILNMHNRLRAKVRLGTEERGIAGPLPAALDPNHGIPALVSVSSLELFPSKRR